MTTMIKTHTLRDGRTLSYADYGEPCGYPIVFSHGLSDSRLLRHWDDAYTKEVLGVRIIAIDQPGVGRSTNVDVKDRTLQKYAKDVQELADDALDIRRFAVAGHSGGGPHALAIAALMKDRVSRVVLLAPPPPLDGVTCPGVDDIMPLITKILITICRWVPFLVNAFCHLVAWWVSRGNNMKKYLELVAAVDRTNGNPETFLGDVRQTRVIEDSFKAGFAQGAAGIQGMFKAVLLEKDWGFDIRHDIPQPVFLFMSDLDSVVPPSVGQCFVDAMPHATTRTWKNAGHYAFVDRPCWTECLTVAAKGDGVNKK